MGTPHRTRRIGRVRLVCRARRRGEPESPRHRAGARERAQPRPQASEFLVLIPRIGLLLAVVFDVVGE